LTFRVSCGIRRIAVNPNQGEYMAKQEKKAFPGGYNKKTLVEGICYCCRRNPIAKGNLRLCTWCHTDPYNYEDRVDPDRITEEDACELIVKVCQMEKTPPTPVHYYSCEEYTQEQLRAILDGGKSE
jgi:hypothetical protein